MKKASIIMAVLACAMIAAAYTNSVPISTTTRAATEKWTAIRFEPALPPTPANAASKFLNGNREWQTAPAELDPVANAALAVHTNRTDNPHGVTAAQIGALTAEADPVAGPRLDLIEPETNKWNAAYGWGDHALAGYLLPADLSPYATTQQVADAAAAIPRDRIVSADGSQWIDATGGVWKVVDTPATNWFYTDSFSPGVTSLLAGVDYPLPPNWHASTPNGVVDCFSDGEIYIYYGSVTFSEYAATIFATISATSATRFEDWFGWAEIFPLEIWSVTTQRVDGVAWQSDLPLYATTQQVAAALAPMATTQHVAEAIASQLPGIIMSNAVSQMTIYTNASGAATSWWQVASGVTNSGSFASGTPGAITNGQTGPLTLGQMQMIENGNVGFGGSPETGTGWPLTVTGSARFNGWVYVGGMIMSDFTIYKASGYSFSTFKNGDVIEAVAWNSLGNVSIPNGSLSVAGTNTAAVVSSQSGYLLPHLGTNTTVSLIFTNGTIQAWEIAQ